MQMNRRVEKLEATLPENEVSFRVLFKNNGEPAPRIDPPLRKNERAIIVNFGRPHHG